MIESEPVGKIYQRSCNYWLKDKVVSLNSAHELSLYSLQMNADYCNESSENQGEGFVKLLVPFLTFKYLKVPIFSELCTKICTC